MFLGSITCPRNGRRRSSNDLQERRKSILEAWQSDVCSSGELPEVEIISLLEEQIPQYRLRADTLTQFTGYENEDWYIPSPALKPDEVDLNLTPDQIREALNYFILCSNRVSQMTKTYNDIEAVTRLLEEKEKDLELTARIGKELLAHNQKLESNVAALETELKQANEKLTQLTHELAKKTELIQILTNDVDESGSESGTPTALRCINLEFMQRRIGSLEEENKQLRSEATQLARDTADCEMAEQKLVQDIASQLASANMEVDGLADDLHRQKDENRHLHEENSVLINKVEEQEARIQKLTAENEELSSVLHVTKENQSELASELADLKDRYNEVLNLLRDTQEQLRRQRRKGMPQARGGIFSSLGTATNQDSIASELESSLHSEMSLDSGIGADTRDHRTPNYKKVFETVRCASRGSSSSTGGSPVHQLYPSGPPSSRFSTGTTSTTMFSSSMTSAAGGPRMSAFVSLPPTTAGAPQALRPGHRGSSLYSSSLSFPSMDSQHSDSEYSVITDSSDDCYPGGARTGVPGAPGAADLEAALRRLTPAEVIARRATLGAGLGYSGYDYSDGGPNTPPSYLPYGCRTPDSIMSTGSSGFSGNSTGSWKLPEKLQIVKPMEGSLTLAAWSQLATPKLSGLLEERPGVKTRGGRGLEDLGLELYSLSDLEEDEEHVNPGKSFQDTGSVYTFTTSTVLHPDDNTNVTSSLRGSQMCTVASSRQTTAPQTPVALSRRNSTSTFSTTLGLAKILNERGIKALTPSAVPTPCGDRSFSPTATPCNSPDGSPPSSPPPSPPPYNPMRFPGSGFLTSGADLLRRTLTGESDRHVAKARSKNRQSKLTLSRSDRKAMTGIRLVEKLERIGLETIMATTASSLSPLTLQGTLYTRRTLKSPMAQLTSLKGAIASPSMASTSSTSSVSSGCNTVITSAAIAKKASTPMRGVDQELGVPGKPGAGLLDRPPPAIPSRKLRAAGQVRPDLGTVFGSVPAKRSRDSNESSSGPTSTLGTISSLLFGRKGGLL